MAIWAINAVLTAVASFNNAAPSEEKKAQLNNTRNVHSNIYTLIYTINDNHNISWESMTATADDQPDTGIAEKHNLKTNGVLPPVK